MIGIGIHKLLYQNSANIHVENLLLHYHEIIKTSCSKKFIWWWLEKVNLMTLMPRHQPTWSSFIIWNTLRKVWGSCKQLHYIQYHRQASADEQKMNSMDTIWQIKIFPLSPSKSNGTFSLLNKREKRVLRASWHQQANAGLPPSTNKTASDNQCLLCKICSTTFMWRTRWLVFVSNLTWNLYLQPLRKNDQNLCGFIWGFWVPLMSLWW